MIVIYHNHSIVTGIQTTDSLESRNYDRHIPTTLIDLALKHPDETLVWCHEALRNHLNVSKIDALVFNKRVLLSYTNYNVPYLGNEIGYVEENTFINVNKTKVYPTWLMSSDVGAVNAAVVNAFKDDLRPADTFDYFLNSLAKQGMPLGLLCYSEPNLLLKNAPRTSGESCSATGLFRFVKQHYKVQWIFLLFLNLMIYEKRFPVIALMASLFYKQRKCKSSAGQIELRRSSTPDTDQSVDVLIPTIGRKKYLYDVLCDLNAQTILPKNVIIVEQNPQPDSSSELDYLTGQDWNFRIKHTFTNQTGVCNARNLALAQIESLWVFMADDDIRMENDFIQRSLGLLNQFGGKAASINCYRDGEKPVAKRVCQFPFFGGGSSIVASDSIHGLRFPMGYEFGFGEDNDFGMQLRNNGCDVLYFSEPALLHLKAPVGGFRVKPTFSWDDDLIQPKPSPTVMLFLLAHYTVQQLRGYKTSLCIRFFRHQPTKNPFRYLTEFRKKWDRSVLLATELMKK